MKNKLIGAVALTLALSPVGMSAAFAEPATATAAAPFRSVAPQTFSSEDLQRYGLDAETAARGEALQSQGYQLHVLSQEEADAYRAGRLSTQSWILIGVGVVVLLAVL